jgi:flagellar hook-length control protein FliK
MQAISAATHTANRRAGLASKAGIKATGLPDFARLLGTALSMNELDGKTAAMGTAAVGGATAALADSAANNATGEPETENSASEEATSDAIAALMGAQAMQTAVAGGPRAAGKGTANMKAAAQRTAAAQATAQTGTEQAAQSAVTAGESKTWNVSELAHQIRAALGSTAQPASTQAAAGAQTATGFLSKAEGDKIRAAGVEKLLKSATGARKADPALAIQPATVQPGASIKALTEQFLGGASANAKNESTAAVAEVAATLGKDQADDLGAAATDSTAAPATGNTPTPLVWTPQPTASESSASHMPSMIEQVRQVADFLAERTEGTVKMGDGGVEANLKLYPPDLGGVRVQLNVTSDHTTQAQFIVERPETAQLLQQHMKSFQQGLESHGLTVDRVQVTVQQTVRPAASGAESGWRQNGMQDSRREAAEWRERQEQNPRRNGRGGGQNPGEA